MHVRVSTMTSVSYGNSGRRMGAIRQIERRIVQVARVEYCLVGTENIIGIVVLELLQVYMYKRRIRGDMGTMWTI